MKTDTSLWNQSRTLHAAFVCAVPAVPMRSLHTAAHVISPASMHTHDNCYELDAEQSPHARAGDAVGCSAQAQSFDAPHSPQQAPGGHQQARADWEGRQGDFVDMTAASSSDEGAAEAATETPVTPEVHGPASGAGCAPNAGAASSTPFKRIHVQKLYKKRRRSPTREDAARSPTPAPQGVAGCSHQLPAVVRGPPAAPVLVMPRAQGCPGDVPAVGFTRLRLHSVHTARLTELIAEGAGFDVAVRLSPARAHCPLMCDDEVSGRPGGEHVPSGRVDHPVRPAPDGEVPGQRDMPRGPRSHGHLDCADAEMDEPESDQHECPGPAEDVSLGATDSLDRGDDFGYGNEYDGAYALDSE